MRRGVEGGCPRWSRGTRRSEPEVRTPCVAAIRKAFGAKRLLCEDSVCFLLVVKIDHPSLTTSALVTSFSRWATPHA
jgi:hypothetical protein